MKTFREKVKEFNELVNGFEEGTEFSISVHLLANYSKDLADYSENHDNDLRHGLEKEIDYYTKKVNEVLKEWQEDEIIDKENEKHKKLHLLKKIVEEIDYDVLQKYEENPELYNPLLEILNETI